MKKILITLLTVFITLNLFSQNYKKLVDISNKWNYLDEAITSNGEGEAKTFSLFISNDTTIQNTTFKKVMSKIIRFNRIDTVYAAAIREDTLSQKVFVKLPNEQERTLYSFNQKIGDTISIDTTNWKDAYTVRYIKSIDTYDFNGSKGKRIEICDTTFRINATHMTPYESYTDFWYEGIGSLKELFELYHIGAFSSRLELLCFWNNGNLNYHNPNRSECQYAFASIDGLEDIKDSGFSIFPNPTTGKVTIESPKQIDNICVVDILGKTILNSRNNYIDLSEFKNGFYILRIKDKSGKHFEKKILKNAP
jgi:hypothetical protein